MDSDNTVGNARYLVVSADCTESMNIDIDRAGPFNTRDEAWANIVEAYNHVLKQDFEMWDDEPEGRRIDEDLGIAEIVGECTSTHWEIIKV